MSRWTTTSRQRLEKAVAVVAEKTGVAPEALFAAGRGRGNVASARVCAMALACAVHVPPAMVAKAFRRDWATVRHARDRQVELCTRVEMERIRFLKLQEEVYR